MAKTTAPLLSFGARGAIADTMVYATWRGIPYVRRYVIPENPQTAEQSKTRDVFRTLSELWKISGTLAIAPWTTFAKSKPLTDRNAFMGKNIETLRGQPNFDLFIGSPGARGGLPPDSVAITPGGGTLTMDFTNPGAPTGWTLVSAICTAFEGQDPAATFTGTVSEGEDAATQIQVILAGLVAQQHQVSSWLEWMKPDGLTAYSVSLGDQGTPT